MSGQCYGCGAQFGMFKKEHGCKNCGFAFCSKCLNEKSIAVPKRNNSKHRVCHKCYKILSGELPANKEQKGYELPEAYLKRMAALQEREKNAKVAGATGASKSHGSGASKVPQHLQRLDPADRQIAMRLEKLKEDNKPKSIPPDREIATRLEKLREDNIPKEMVSDADLNARLAQLKGQTYTPEKRPVYQAPDRRTQVEQVDDLLEQLSSEVEIDALRPDPASEVEARLAQLRFGKDGGANKPAVDANNTNQQDKSGLPGAVNNDLSKVDKMGQISKPYNKNINVRSTNAAGSQSEENVDLEDVHQLMSVAARELEEDARRQVAGLQQDKEIAQRLRQVQMQQRKRAEEDGAAGGASQGAQGSNSGGEAASNALGAAGIVGDEDSEEENEDAEADRVLQRYLEEAKLDERAGLGDDEDRRKRADASKSPKKKGKKVKDQSGTRDSSPKASNIKPPKEKDFASDSDYDDSDELPYCCMCSEDASIRCQDCDLDLYCKRCFRESHEEMHILGHRTTPYKMPKGYR